MLKSVIFEVIGDQQLCCSGSEERIERMLKTFPGVDKVRANANNQHIDVHFNSAVQNENAISERLAKAGYQTKIVSFS